MFKSSLFKPILQKTLLQLESKLSVIREGTKSEKENK